MWNQHEHITTTTGLNYTTLVSTQIWVKYGQTQMLGWKCNLKIVKKLQLKLKVEVGLKF